MRNLKSYFIVSQFSLRMFLTSSTWGFKNELCRLICCLPVWIWVQQLGNEISEHSASSTKPPQFSRDFLAEAPLWISFVFYN